jgi:PAS domain S-box-containing protein
LSSSYSFYWPGAFRHALDQVRYFVTRTSDDRSAGLVRVGEYLVQFTIVFAAYLIAGKLGQATTNLRSSNLGPVWPAYGIALGAILVCGYQIWPAIAAAVFLVALWSPESALTALGQATGSTLAALSGAFFLRRVKFHNSFSRLRDVLGLVLLGALGSAIVSASAGVSVLYASHVHAYSGPGSAWLIYWLGDSTGVLLVTPLVLTFPTLFRICDGHQLREFAVLLLLLTATSFAAFGLLPLVPGRVHHMAFAVLPFVMWAAIRFGMSVTALSIFLVTTIATVETALGSGPFTTNTPLMNAVLLDIFFGVVSVTGLSLAAAVAEREHAERERERLVRERAEAEARLRFAAIVESCEDAIISGTLDGIIVSWNGGAQRIYGYTEAEAVGKPIAILLPPELADEENKILETLRAEGRIEHFETVRVTKTGKRINVSLTISAIRDSTGRTVGISGIARDITERSRAKEALLSSEQRYRLLFEKNVAGVGIASLDGRVLDCNDRWAHILGYESRDEIRGRLTSEFYFNPAERQPLLDELSEKQVLLSRRVQLKRKDGSPVLVLFNGAELHVGKDTILRQATMIDISEWKRTEEVLSGMTRKLIEAQEQERARIGRELHDDINQRLAMLAVGLGQLEEDGSDLPTEIRSRMRELRQQTAEIGANVQALSHELHSSGLEYLGVVGGMKNLCREFGQRQGVEVDFRSSVARNSVPSEIGLCLFRVLQEALHNAAKYSGVKHVRVLLREESCAIHLNVSDSGRGFDIEVATQGRGLGLTSMHERVRLVNGTIEINSKPMSGTSIHVRVPLPSDQDSQRAAV